MLRKDFKLAHLSLIFVVIFLSFVTFFIPNPTFPRGEGEESKQKNQILCRDSSFCLKISSARKKYSSAPPDFKQFLLRQTIFLQKLEFLPGTSENTVTLNKMQFENFGKKVSLRNMS